jgi:hypothetical protein
LRELQLLLAGWAGACPVCLAAFPGRRRGYTRRPRRHNEVLLVAHQRTLTLADLMARARREVAFTIECSGNHGPHLPDGRPWFIGGIGNAPHLHWSGQGG